jgi:hypothetical protein
MKYIALIYGVDGTLEKLPEAEANALHQEYYAFAREAREAGVMTGGAPLAPVSAATSIRMRDGERLIADGPFAETKEILGGFFEFECKDLDEAIDWASRIPGVRYGTIEVRPTIPT